MANFFDDNEDIKFHFANLKLDEIVSLKENNFADKNIYDYAPVDYEDARDNYLRILHLAGEICADYIAPRAPEIDHEGSNLVDGKVVYAKGLQEAMDILTKADLMGVTLPREYGGLNFPNVINNIIVEMISQADASLMNLVGLQDIAVTINKFADKDLKAKYLPLFAEGKVTGAMALTEPDAGSDLQAVQLKATEDASTGLWRLNGVKRFITNGCGDVVLVLARSEEGVKGGRGLSMFVYERDQRCTIRRVENKLGIKGSPTCELQFNDAPAYLVGKRKMGLIKYVMSLMNGARIGVALQALGIAQAAYNEAFKYSREREQFGRKIIVFPAVYDMLTTMKVEIEAARSLIYSTSLIIDMLEGLEDQLEKSRVENPAEIKIVQEKAKNYEKLANVLTPLCKYYASEMSIRVTSAAIQVFGGTGYMKEFNVERHYRDARITSIYEGTSQFQVIAAIGGILTGTLSAELERIRKESYPEELNSLLSFVDTGINEFNSAIEFVKAKKDPVYNDYIGRLLTDIGVELYMSLLFLQQARLSGRKKAVAEIFIQKAFPRIIANAKYILNGDRSVIQHHAEILGLAQ